MTHTPASDTTPTSATLEEPKKLKPCCACPETKKPRDQWWVVLYFILETTIATQSKYLAAFLLIIINIYYLYKRVTSEREREGNLFGENFLCEYSFFKKKKKKS